MRWFGPIAVFMVGVVSIGSLFSVTSFAQEAQTLLQEKEAQIQLYQTRLREAKHQSGSLREELQSLDQRQQDQQALLSEIKALKELVKDEIQDAEEEVKKIEETLLTEKSLLARLVRRGAEGRRLSPLELLATRPSLSDFFSTLAAQDQWQEAVTQAVSRMREQREQLEMRKKNLGRKTDVLSPARTECAYGCGGIRAHTWSQNLFTDRDAKSRE
jgi:septal ring factor EnvC (AmiA/AmiB activator)